MPWYNDLRPDKGDDKKKDYALLFPEMTQTEKIRCIENLLVLRDGLDREIPAKKTDQNLLLASWNIKELGHTTQRLPEAYFYLAEILNRFDLIAVQEVKSSLKDIDILLRLLGSDWAYMVNDITEGRSGNSERSAYIYNKKSIELSGIAGEITLWEELTATAPIKQLKRTPYITGFQSGWKKFSLINLHLHPGEDDDDLALRYQEVKLFLAAIAEKLRNNRFWNDNLIVLGDFNFYSDTAQTEKDGPAVQLFNDSGFRELDQLQGANTNASQTQGYDRLFFRTNKYFQIQRNEQGAEKAGVFNPFRYVFTDGQVPVYAAAMREDYQGNLSDEAYFQRYWKKNQISDHFPIWTEIIIDSSDSFLREKLQLIQNN